MNIEPVAVYSEADVDSPHVDMAAAAVCIGEPQANRSYLNATAILDAARKTGAQAIHPGYGFLSENAEFAAACEAAGIAFIGPTPEQIRTFGLKNTARETAQRSNAPILPGTGLLRDAQHAVSEALRIGLPVMLKSAGGGGGIGMLLCRTEAEVLEAFESVQRLSESHFKGSGIYLEKFISNGRHIEVQIFGDGNGRVVALGERDCSVQRRNQKVMEETPAPGISDAVRHQLHTTAVEIMQAVKYRSAGTVEFLYDTESAAFYFLEVNTRLQVEHGVTEEVTRVDLVEWMVRQAAGDSPLTDNLSIQPSGASIQVRLYAESPIYNFRPSSGVITEYRPPTNCRHDGWVQAGANVTPYYDPLLAKIIVHGANRQDALTKLESALQETRISGIETNLEFLRAVCASPEFQFGGVTTRFLNSFHFSQRCVRVIEPGVLTTVQEDPGRLGFWAVGVPPSGPMDPLSFRLGNRLLGNERQAPGLECTLSGPALEFLTETRIVITGANMQPKLDGRGVPLWTVLPVASGTTLTLGAINGPGARTYILVEGGIDAARYLGSATTFTLGKFGGHAGRALRTGDVLPLPQTRQSVSSDAPHLSAQLEPQLTNEWTIGVLYGPHGAPDFFTDEDIATFFSTSWRVHHNSSRTGVRLIGPKPRWARSDGGDAGLHPSNIHDNAYAIGAVDFTGDMPVLLGPDGPSLGGFVCPAVVAHAELWKMGQLSPRDSVRFVRITPERAEELEENLEATIDTLQHPARMIAQSDEAPLATPVLSVNPDRGFLCRAAGDKYLLIEFGEAKLDLNLRFRAHALMSALQRSPIPGIIDLTPGIRSLQIHYDSRALRRQHLLDIVDETLADLPALDNISLPARTVHLPLSWDDPATRLAIERYMTSVRPDAPWCPSNLEFIRRVNGLASIDDVRRIVFDASYLVLGLGDVYLGAPVATPLDPRHRLVTTKYNPARTWTPENAVGIGGAYLCIYGMEGPGGYQFVGRTLQVWNTYRQTQEFEAGKPWLLRFFDQIRFYPVSSEELLEMRGQFLLGRTPLQIEHHEFRLADYDRFLNGIKQETNEFRSRQTAAFDEERRRWVESGEFNVSERDNDNAPPQVGPSIPEGCLPLCSPTTASVWKLEAKAGERIQAGQRVMLLEAMKMEIAVTATQAGEVVDVLCQPGAMVTAGQPLVVYRPLA